MEKTYAVPGQFYFGRGDKLKVREIPDKFVSCIEAALEAMEAYPSQHIDLFHHNDTDGLTPVFYVLCRRFWPRRECG